MWERILELLEEGLNYRSMKARQATYWSAVVLGVIAGTLGAGGIGAFITGIFQISPAAVGLQGVAEWWVILGVLGSFFDILFGRQMNTEFMVVPPLVILGPILVEFLGLDIIGRAAGFSVVGFLQWFIVLGLLTAIVFYPAARKLRMPMARGLDMKRVAAIVVGLAVLSALMASVVERELSMFLQNAMGLDASGILIVLVLIIALMTALFLAHERVPGI